MKLSFQLLVAIITIGITGKAQENLIDKDLLLADYRLLKTAFEEAHPALYKFTPKPVMDSLLDATELKINRAMSEREFSMVIAPVISAVKCGHTRFRPSKSFRKNFIANATCFPLDIKILDEKIFVVSNFSKDSSITPGTEIVAIDGVPAKIILSQLCQLNSSDGNNMSKKYRDMESVFFVNLYQLKGEQQEYRLSLKALDSKSLFEKSISSIKTEERQAAQMKQRVKEPVAKLNFVNESTASISVKSFDTNRLNRELGNYNNWVDSVFTVLEKSQIKNLIIDLRGNEGGYSMNSFYLFSYIARSRFNMLKPAVFKTDKRLSYFDDESITDWYQFKPIEKGGFIWSDDDSGWLGVQEPKANAFKGKLCLLTNGSTFSSAGFFSTLVRYYERGSIIGEETGGNSVCNDSHGTLILPNSQLEVHVARAIWELNLPKFESNGHGVIPDLKVSPSIESVLIRKDEVVEVALKEFSHLK